MIPTKPNPTFTVFKTILSGDGNVSCRYVDMVEVLLEAASTKNATSETLATIREWKNFTPTQKRLLAERLSHPIFNLVDVIDYTNVATREQAAEIIDGNAELMADHIEEIDDKTLGLCGYAGLEAFLQLAVAAAPQADRPNLAFKCSYLLGRISALCISRQAQVDDTVRRIDQVFRLTPASTRNRRGKKGRRAA